MPAKKKSGGALFKMKDEGKVAGSKSQRLYSGSVGNHQLGTVVAGNKTLGRKKLMSLARKLLK